MKKIIFDVKTGETKEQPLTEEETQKKQEMKNFYQAQFLAEQEARAEKQAKLESAKAKLTALGLDEAEVQAILGL